MNYEIVVKQVKLFTRMVHSDMRHFLWYNMFLFPVYHKVPQVGIISSV